MDIDDLGAIDARPARDTMLINSNHVYTGLALQGFWGSFK